MALPGSTVADIPVPSDMISTASSRTGYSVITSFLQKQGREVDRVLGDGNCLFRALSFQLTGIQDHHMAIRKLIAQCESKCTIFEGLHTTNNQTKFADHIKNIRKSCI